MPVLITPFIRSARDNSINWPSNTIDLSQIETLFTQNQGLNQLNIKFPNQANWNVTLNQLQNIVGKLQQEAQSVGLNGKVPDLSFSSLAMSALTDKNGQLSIDNLKNGNITSQMDNVLRQLRYQEMNLSNALPDWLKRILLAVYDTVYNCMQFLGNKLAALFGAR